MCLLTDSLRHQVRKLQKEVTRLKSTHEHENLVTMICKETSKSVPEGQPEVVLESKRSRALEKEPTPLVKEDKSCLSTVKRTETAATKVVIVVSVYGVFLLQGTEASIYWLDLLPQEVCYLPGAQLQDVLEGLPRLTQPSD